MEEEREGEMIPNPAYARFEECIREAGDWPADTPVPPKFIPRPVDSRDAELDRLRRELGEAREALSVADKSLSLAWQDLCEWRQFARYNVRGEICFEPGRIPDPPQRPTEAGLAATELAIGEVVDAIRVVRKLSSPEAHPAPGGEGRETD